MTDLLDDLFDAALLSRKRDLASEGAALSEVLGEKSTNVVASFVTPKPAVHRDLPPVRDIVNKDPERLPWPDDWFDLNDPVDAQRCRAMYAAALLHHINAIFKPAIKDLEQGLSLHPNFFGWIGGSNFRWLASCAGLDAQACVERLKPMLGDLDQMRGFLSRMVREDGGSVDA